jgi:hypothetical protein
MSAIQNNIIIQNETDPRFAIPGVLVASGAVSTILAGTPTKSADAASAATGAVVPMVDTDGTIAQNFSGIAKSDSTDTVAAAGSVTLWLPLPGLVYACKAKTASDANTAAKVQALFRKSVIFDLTSSLWSVDAGATDALVNCVVIVGGDFNTQTLYFVYKSSGTIMNQTHTS